MNSAPITTWEGAEAYFTFADKPGVLILIFCLAMATTALVVYLTAKHETDSYARSIKELRHLR